MTELIKEKDQIADALDKYVSEGIEVIVGYSTPSLDLSFSGVLDFDKKFKLLSRNGKLTFGKRMVKFISVTDGYHCIHLSTFYKV